MRGKGSLKSGQRARDGIQAESARIGCAEEVERDVVLPTVLLQECLHGGFGCGVGGQLGLGVDAVKAEQAQGLGIDIGEVLLAVLDVVGKQSVVGFVQPNVVFRV